MSTVIRQELPAVASSYVIVEMSEPAAGPGADDGVRALVQAWLVGCASDESRRAYARDVGLTPPTRATRYVSWLDFCHRSGLHPVRDVTRVHVDGWLQVLAAAGLAQSTRSRALSAVSSFYGWLVKEEKLGSNPAGRVDRTRQQLRVDAHRSDTKGLTPLQVGQLLAAADAAVTALVGAEDDLAAARAERAAAAATEADALAAGDTAAADAAAAQVTAATTAAERAAGRVHRGRHARRDAVIVAMLYYLGLRVAELVGVDEHDLGTDTGHRTVTVTRKGGRTQSVPMPPQVVARLDDYRDHRPVDVDRLLPTRTAGAAPVRPLLCGEYGGRIDATVIRRMLRRLAAVSGLDPDVVLHPHMLRHSCATALLGAGAPLADVQDLLGHLDPRTTRRYDVRDRLDRSPVYAHPPVGIPTPDRSRRAN